MALVATLAGLGVPAGDSVVGVLIYRLISLWLVLLVGWTIFFGIGPRRRAPLPQPEPSKPPHPSGPADA